MVQLFKWRVKYIPLPSKNTHIMNQTLDMSANVWGICVDRLMSFQTTTQLKPLNPTQILTYNVNQIISAESVFELLDDALLPAPFELFDDALLLPEPCPDDALLLPELCPQPFGAGLVLDCL